MKPKLILPLVLAAVVMAVPAVSEQDPFEVLKDSMSEAPCVRLEFLSVVESQVFGSVDSVCGTVEIARDGRYRLDLGADIYLYDCRHRHVYSAANNQVTVERVDSAEAVEDLAWITRIDRHYRTETVEIGKTYRLLKLGNSSDLPDSMTVTINPESTALQRLSYYDLNDDLNVIEVLDQAFESACSDSAFVPSFPDSVDVVRLN